jgi:hypothetical protein
MTRPALVRAGRPDVVPLSFAQQRLWFLSQLEGPSPTYNVPIAFRLQAGDLDTGALLAALGDLAERHESLRTVFRDDGGVPRQLILDAADAYPSLTASETTPGQLPQAIADASGQGFDLSAEPPLRAFLFRTAPADHVLLLLAHRIAVDGWSEARLARDLAAAYRARRAGTAPAQAPLPVQYADYALWQRGLLDTEDDPGSLISQQVAYWQQALAGLPDQIYLPADRPRPAVASHRGAVVPFTLSPQTHARILELARTHNATLFIVVQAAFAALLTRLGAGTDIPIGSPIAGRTDDALDGLVGSFANTLVLRTDTSGNPSFSKLISRVRDTDLAAYAHQDLPFERLVEILDPARSMARPPLFQVMLTLNTAPAATEFDLPGITVTAQPAYTGTAKFDLSLYIDEHATPDGLAGAMEYALDLFDETTITTMTRRLAQLLDQAAADPGRPLSALDVLDPREKQQILADWNDTARDIPPATLPALFEDQARRTPQAPGSV